MTQDHLLGAYTLKYLLLEDRAEENNSEWADAVREDMETLWNLMSEDTRKMARVVSARLGTFSIIRNCVKKCEEI